MDFDELQQNMNTRVVFKEPRGMVRWLQLFFAIVASSTVVDFYTSVGINITCPTVPVSTSTTTTVAPANSSAPTPAPAPVPVSPAVLPTQALTVIAQLNITYPFDFGDQKVNNTCPGQTASYQHQSPLNGSPQFFVMTAVLCILYASVSLVVYLLFSSTYESIPVLPVTDLIVTAILCIFWFIASSSFSSGVSLLKNTATYPSLAQVVCPTDFLSQPGAACQAMEGPMWKSLNIALISGFTSFFLWGSGLWFVYKETHFHIPRDSFGPR